MQPFMHLVQRIAELQEVSDGMESVEKLKGAHDSQLSSRCRKLAGQTTPLQANVQMLYVVYT